MRKRKDGKIEASLTEVKNKTGDIFTLVDEFGEVILTSYNKAKYRILKIDINEILQLDDEKKTKKDKKSVMDKVKSSVGIFGKSNIKEDEVIEEKQVTLPSKRLDITMNDFVEQLKNIKIWDKNSGSEKSYLSKIKSALQ
jgi:hypothetical protein